MEMRACHLFLEFFDKLVTMFRVTNVCHAQLSALNDQVRQFVQNE